MLLSFVQPFWVDRSRCHPCSEQLLISWPISFDGGVELSTEGLGEVGSSVVGLNVGQSVMPSMPYSVGLLLGLRLGLGVGAGEGYGEGIGVAAVVVG
jgi:hypothetical protein